MLHPIRRQYVAVFCVFLMIAVPVSLPGCDGELLGDIALSSAKLTPGQFLTITHRSILEGSTVEVEFRGSDGFLVSVEAIDTQDGSLRVAVPPFVVATTGEFRAAEVTVSIKGIDSQRSLMINDLLELEGVEPGAILRLFLEAAIESNQSTLNNLALIESELQGSFDSSAAVAAINQEIQSLQGTLNQLNTTGALVVDLAGIGPVTVGSDDLRRADRLLVSMLAGVTEQAGTDGSSKRVGALKGGLGSTLHKDIGDCIPPPPNAQQSTPDCIREVLNDIRRATGQGTNLASMLATSVGLVVTVGGLIAASPEIALTGLIVAVIGAGTSFSNAAVNDQNTDSFLNNDRPGFDAGQEGASQLIRVGTSIVSNVPVIGAPAQAVNVGLSVNDLINGAEAVRCSGDRQKSVNLQVITGVLEFCQVTPPLVEDEPDAGGCSNTCTFASDGDCDDGGLGSDFSLCDIGTDCADCGSRSGGDVPPDGEDQPGDSGTGVCGDGVCDAGAGELTNCPGDCPAECGDGICNASAGEEQQCPQDCPEVQCCVATNGCPSEELFTCPGDCCCCALGARCVRPDGIWICGF